MKSQKGITLTSVTIYIIIVLIVIGILSVITANFQGNMKEIYSQGTNNIEIDKFNVYFLKDVKKQGNKIDTILNNEIVFALGNKYTFNNEENCIYLNNSIIISENIEKCEFSKKTENEKEIITVIIKAISGEEKVIDYVMNNQEVEENFDNEFDYTSYIPKDWDISKLNTKNPIQVQVFNNKIYIVPIPKGFEISGLDSESTIENGLVIYEMTEQEKLDIDWSNSEEVENAKQTYNQFVWIPVETKWDKNYSINAKVLVGTGVVEVEVSEPINLESIDNNINAFNDSQEVLDYYYGENYYKYNQDFNYELHYSEMVSSVNKYNGFYIGRYETTINETKIGSIKNKKVITIADKLDNGQIYRWWGLYDFQRNANVKGNGISIQTSMIWGRQWNAMLEFIGQEQALSTISPDINTVLLSGEATYANNKKDIIKNINDIRKNVREFTGMASAGFRVSRGGYCLPKQIDGNVFENTPTYYGALTPTFYNEEYSKYTRK